jgi:hypothetical protein
VPGLGNPRWLRDVYSSRMHHCQRQFAPTILLKSRRQKHALQNRMLGLKPAA